MAGRRTPAVTALEQARIAFTVHEYRHDPSVRSYGEEAALLLGFDPARVLKTLVADVDGRLAVGVVPVSGQLSLKALAAALSGKRAAMADAAAVTRSTGYVIGGVSPLGQRAALPTVIDRSALDHATVLVSAGRRGLDVELDPRDLVQLTDGVVASIRDSRPS